MVTSRTKGSAPSSTAHLSVAIGKRGNSRFDGELAGACARGHFVVEHGCRDGRRSQSDHVGPWGPSSAAYFLRSTLSRTRSRLTRPGPEKNSHRKLSP